MLAMSTSSWCDGRSEPRRITTPVAPGNPRVDTRVALVGADRRCDPGSDPGLPGRDQGTQRRASTNRKSEKEDEMSVTTQPRSATGVRPFTVDVSQAELDDLRRRLADTRWPDRETVNDSTQGAQLARMQELVRY